jgi:hypothetical protein
MRNSTYHIYVNLFAKNFQTYRLIIECTAYDDFATEISSDARLRGVDESRESAHEAPKEAARRVSDPLDEARRGWQRRDPAVSS